MSRAVLVAFDFGRDYITAQWRIGSSAGSDLCWEAPAPIAGGPSFCATDECRALILEGLAIIHFPNVDTLVLAVPASEVETHRRHLEQTYTGTHEVRNTECRSQRLTVQVRRVVVVPQPLDAFLAAPSS